MIHVLKSRLNSKLTCSGGHSYITSFFRQLGKVWGICHLCVYPEKALIFIRFCDWAAKQNRMVGSKAMIASPFQICWTGQEPSTLISTSHLKRDICSSICLWIDLEQDQCSHTFTHSFCRINVWSMNTTMSNISVILWDQEAYIFSTIGEKKKSYSKKENKIKRQRSRVAKVKL